MVAEVDILEVEVHRNNGSAPAARTEASEERKWHYVTSVMLNTTITNLPVADKVWDQARNILA